MDKGTILVIEDEENIASLISLYLKNEGFSVEQAASGEEGLTKLETSHPKLVILDLMLPGMDGFEVCRQIRKNQATPIIMLTARETEIDKIVGLEIGADDYITKPFSPRELIARVKAVLRRVEEKYPKPEIIKLGNLEINISQRKVKIGGKEIDLTAKEFDLLLYLTQNKNIVLPREQILSKVWGYDYYGGSRTVDVHIRQIRSKLGKDCPVQTVWGVGYKVE